MSDPPGAPRIPPVPEIEVRDLVKRWTARDATVTALDGISLQVVAQEFLTVLGP